MRRHLFYAVQKSDEPNWETDYSGKAGSGSRVVWLGLVGCLFVSEEGQAAGCVVGDGWGDGCVTCAPREIPAMAVMGRRTSTFNVVTTPAGLLRDHLTGVWAELVVLVGSVLFVEETSRRIVATPGRCVVIVPGVRHRVEPAEDAEFYIQFYERDRP